MTVRLISLVINTNQISSLVTFYKAIGINLQPAKVSIGSEYYKAIFPSFEFAIYGVKNKSEVKTPNFQLSFHVQHLDQILKNLKTIGGECILDPIESTEGNKAIVLDPDGHSVELIEDAR